MIPSSLRSNSPRRSQPLSNSRTRRESKARATSLYAFPLQGLGFRAWALRFGVWGLGLGLAVGLVVGSRGT
jgi:hypothetical protein